MVIQRTFHDTAQFDGASSIQAYPDNASAIHAYADLQHQVAARRNRFDAVTIELLDEAVETLETQNELLWKSDQYPIVTLADKYVGALVKHAQIEEARTAARKYFAVLDQMVRQSSAELVRRARERLAVFLSTGEWRTFDAPRMKRGKSRRPHRPKNRPRR